MAQMVVDGGGGEPLAVALVGSDVEIFVEILQGRWRHLEVAVVLDDGLRFLGCEPPPFPVLPDDGAGLSVEPHSWAYSRCWRVPSAARR